jgi:hypothetical protein
MRPKLDLIGSKENCKSSSGKSPLDQEKRFASVLFAIQQKSKIIVSDSYGLLDPHGFLLAAAGTCLTVAQD